MSRPLTRVALALLALALPPAAGAARGQAFDLEVLNEGKAEAGVEVLLALNEGKVTLGSTGPDGTVEARTADVALEPGEPVDVYRIECDGTVAIVIVPPADEQALREECERRRRENPDCVCDRIGGFLWGEDVTIDVGRGTVTPRRYAVDGARLGAFRIGAGVGYSYYPELDRGLDVDGVLDGDVDDAAVYYQAMAEWLLAGGPFLLGLEVGYTPSLRVTQSAFAVDGGFPRRNTVDMDVLSAGPYGGLSWSLGPSQRVALFLVVAALWTWNFGDTTTLVDGDELTDSRDESGLRIGGRAGLDLWFDGGAWGSRLELGGMRGEGDDIDTNLFFVIKLLWRAPYTF